MFLVIVEEFLFLSFIIDVLKLIFVGSIRLSFFVVRNVGKYYNGIMVFYRRIRKSYLEWLYLYCIIWRCL